MEISAFQPYAWDILLNPSMLLPYYHVPVPENYVHWRETPESHIYSADIPGVRKEEIKVEVEDSKYLIIRTEAVGVADQSSEAVAVAVAVAEAGPPRRFMRKFRLPGRVDVDGISAGYEDGVLRITVPRRGFHIQLADLTDRLEVTARAA